MIYLSKKEAKDGNRNCINYGWHYGNISKNVWLGLNEAEFILASFFALYSRCIMKILFIYKEEKICTVLM